MKLPGKKYLITVTLFATTLYGSSTQDITLGEDAFPIAQFLDSTSGTPIAVIHAGKNQGIVDDASFVAYRRGNDTWIQTGTLKALEVSDDHTIAQVTQEKTVLSQAFFPKFAGVMAGDLIKEKKFTIARAQIMTPELTFFYHDIFVDPRSSPQTFELSETGKEKLKIAAQVFGHVHLSTLIVEGHTDQTGNAHANQVESYQRALTVRQFLSSELGFHLDKLTAFGFGETEPAVQEFSPGYHEHNRRIVLKAIAHHENSEMASTSQASGITNLSP